MPHAILTTKLSPPPPRARLAARERVVRLLEDGVRHRLTLVSAPAGYGKTTALTAWLARTRHSVAWLSLDQGDNAPRRLLRHLVATLQQRDDSLRELGDFVGEDLEAALITVVNDIALNEAPLVLVLDDLHDVQNERVMELLRFLLDHAPAQLRLLVATRVDPPLPLARLRVADELSEVRSEELRFTDDEAAELLASLDLRLPEEDVRELVLRTEGWAAGLQLAALSLQGREDARAFIGLFAGTDRFVLAYLTEEVLMRQPQPVQDFLLLSAVLESFDTELAAAVTGLREAGARIAELLRRNLFLVPLDAEGRRFRYHAFFRDLLLHRLLEARPDLVPELHRRAAATFEARGDVREQLRHCWLAGDVHRAAALLEGLDRGAAVRAEALRALDEAEGGQPLADLLERLAARGTTPALRGRILEVLEDDPGDTEETAAGRPEPRSDRGPAGQAAPEPLSERELEVLLLIAAGLANKQIARRLDISLNTVKTHAKNVYAKLAVSSRTEAAARAHELGLV